MADLGSRSRKLTDAPMLPDDPAERQRLLETLVAAEPPTCWPATSWTAGRRFSCRGKIGRGEVIFCSTRPAVVVEHAAQDQRRADLRPHPPRA